MVSSMTGFSNAGAERSGFSWTFEAKSVNGRGFDLRLNLPSGCEALENDIRSKFKFVFARGNMQASLQIKDRTEESSVRVDTRLLTALARQARQTDRVLKGRSRTSELMALRGVLSGEKAASTVSPEDGTGKAILRTVDDVLSGLLDARRREGQVLKGVLLRILADMTAECALAVQTADAQPDKMKARLRERIATVLEDGKINAERLEQEIAILITKADVTEEIDRLAAHLNEGKRLLDMEEPVGRKLDFLSQEMLREANTLGSKSASLEMTRHSLTLKTLIDQFKEQAANVE